jgi:hypothetical protein
LLVHFETMTQSVPVGSPRSALRHGHRARPRDATNSVIGLNGNLSVAKRPDRSVTMNLRHTTALTFFIGQVLFLLCCAVICSLSLLPSLACRAEEASLSPVIKLESANGAAALTYWAELRKKKSFVFSANLDLPELTNNQSWYCVWIMVSELKGTSQHPSMLQVGLMRWDQSKFQMQPFVTTERADQELMFKPIGGNLTGYHRFAISDDPSTIELRMDGKVLTSASRKEFFKDEIIYLKIAAEVYAVGDRVSGLVSDVTLVTDAGKEETPSFYAAFEDRGLKFLCKGNGRWEATGQFDPALRFAQYRAPLCR